MFLSLSAARNRHSRANVCNTKLCKDIDKLKEQLKEAEDQLALAKVEEKEASDNLDKVSATYFA